MSLDIRPNPSATGSVTGGLEYKGSYNATTNSPDLTSSLKGDFYIVSVGGTLAGVTLDVGDHIVFNQDASSPINSAMFDKIDNTDAVASVNGQTGPVVLDTDDISEQVGATNLYYTNARFDTQLGTKTTDNLTEGSSNLYYTNARFDTQLGTKDTDDLSEGSSNLYYTNARFDTQLGTKTTDNVTEGSSNLYYTNARFDTQLGTKDTGDLSEGSNLYYTNARADARIGAANLTDLNDVNYTAGAAINGYVLEYVHANTRWEAKEATGGISQVNGDSGPNVTLDTDDISEGSSNLYYTNARFDTQLGTKTTDNLTEGSSNLYYTNARFDTQLGTKDTDDLSEGTSNLYYTNARFDTQLGTKTTDNLTEGSSNLYYTNARFDTQLGTKTTDNLTEGSSNLYYTNARFDTQLGTKDTGDLSEGSNLYYTNARADARIAAANLTDLNDVNYTAGSGINNYVLTYVHANTRWEAKEATGGGGGSAPDVVTDASGTDTTISTTTGIEEVHLISNGSSAVVITIPSASTSGEGYKYQIKRLGTANVTVKTATPASDGQIDSSDTYVLTAQNQSVTIVSDASDYFII